MKNTAHTIGTLFVAAGLFVTGGCQNDKVVYNDVNNGFAPDPVKRDVDHIADAQAAAGARADATLQPAHFDGTALNSLGRAKLNLMLKDEESAGGTHAPVTVFVNVPADDATFAGRRDAVSGYLVAAGLSSNDVKVEAGRNPANWGGSQPGLIRLPKTESPEIGTGGGVGATASVAGDAAK